MDEKLTSETLNVLSAPCMCRDAGKKPLHVHLDPFQLNSCQPAFFVWRSPDEIWHPIQLAVHLDDFSRHGRHECNRPFGSYKPTTVFPLLNVTPNGWKHDRVRMRQELRGEVIDSNGSRPPFAVFDPCMGTKGVPILSP